jgi:DUF4097 and DUF4098 domain-containing protein YvlB
MSKKFLAASIILITVGLVLITNAIAQAQSQNQFTVPLADPAKRGKLNAHLNYGSITVKGTARKDILVRYASAEEDEQNDNLNKDLNKNSNKNRRDDDDDDDSRAGLKRIGGGGMDLEVTESNNVVKIHSNSWHHRLNLEIEVPSGIDLQLHTYNGGDLMVTNVQGELALSNYNGEITALNISGSVVASTYNGEIKVTFDGVTANTPMSYSTYNGDIDLTFPATLKATLKMKTEQGEILTGFDVNITSSGPVQMKDTKAGVTRIVVDDWKRGDVNGGGPEITMKNYNGDILIRKK